MENVRKIGPEQLVVAGSKDEDDDEMWDAAFEAAFGDKDDEGEVGISGASLKPTVCQKCGSTDLFAWDEKVLVCQRCGHEHRCQIFESKTVVKAAEVRAPRSEPIKKPVDIDSRDRARKNRERALRLLREKAALQDPFKNYCDRMHAVSVVVRLVSSRGPWQCPKCNADNFFRTDVVSYVRYASFYRRRLSRIFLTKVPNSAGNQNAGRRDRLHLSVISA